MNGVLEGKKRTPRVSVIMPVFNACASLDQAIGSVLAQSFRDFELIVIDDGSTDGSASLADDYALADSRVVVIHQPNQGVAVARNRGLQVATGELVAFLDADDWWHPGKLDVQVQCMHDLGVKVSYTCYERVDRKGSPLNSVSPPREVDFKAMLIANHIGNLTGMYDRSLGGEEFKQIGHEDYLFWLEKVRQAGRAVRVAESTPLAYYRISDSSLSSNKFRAAKWRWNIYRRYLHLNVVSSLSLMVVYALLAAKKRVVL